MIYLLLSIVCASTIFLIFKYFRIFGVNTFAAIIINYITAAGIGYFIVIDPPQLEEMIKESWFPIALLTGAAFIALFTLMAVVTQKVGASVASVTVKMAVVIPISLAFVLYDDRINFTKLAGITLALVGIYLSSTKPNSSPKSAKGNLLLLTALFIGSGLLDSVMKYAEEMHLSNDPSKILKFVPTIFAFAAIFGSLFLLAGYVLQKKKQKLEKQDFIWGILLGIINYGSIYFLLSALNFENWESSVVFPINNMGIVALTSMASMLLFKEKLFPRNILGIFISILAIALIAFSF